jgi:hypothetical protein
MEKEQVQKVSVGKIPESIYEFYVSTININDIRNAIDFFERAKTDERYILYFRHALISLKFMEEILS